MVDPLFHGKAKNLCRFLQVAAKIAEIVKINQKR